MSSSMYAWMYLCMYSIYIYVCEFLKACIYTWMYVCMHVCIHGYFYVCIFVPFVSLCQVKMYVGEQTVSKVIYESMCIIVVER